MIEKDYLETLKERRKKSHVYKKFQHIGLLISQLLRDEKHKALYIKLARNHDPDILYSVARDVSERENIENKGGYFMKVLQGKGILRKELKIKSFKKSTIKTLEIKTKNKNSKIKK